MKKIFQGKAKILQNRKAGSDYFKMVIAAPQVAALASPGQFLQVKVSDSDEPLLRRPLSIHRIKSGKIELLYEVIGKGTQLLAQRKPAEFLDIIGPLGNGFALRKPAIIVAGGMGVAPLLFLAEKLKAYSLQPTAVLIGAKTKSQILCEEEFKRIGCEVKIATDDGSRGFPGKVTDLLKHFLTTDDLRLTTIYACGPRPMLKAISRISREKNIPAQLSLEEHLACGIGACMGCVVKTRDGFKRVCKEGPVFLAKEVLWE